MASRLLLCRSSSLLPHQRLLRCRLPPQCRFSQSPSRFAAFDHHFLTPSNATLLQRYSTAGLSWSAKRMFSAGPSTQVPTSSLPKASGRGETLAAPRVTTVSKSSQENAKPEVVKENEQSRLERIWGSIKKEVVHYWSGFKLLSANVKAATKLLHKKTKGKNLTRRERKLLTRTAADVARLVPFLFFILIPFMEFLLPFALKLFPGMLPSTFHDRHHKEEKMKKQLQMRLDLAEFLQETTEVMAQNIKNRTEGEASDSAKNLVSMLQRVREGKHVTNDDLLDLASLFKDELTLDHLSRPQLLSMCRYMGLPAYGSDFNLRRGLERRLEEIRQDDQVIRDEGIDELTDPELRAACAHRGIRVLGVGESTLRERLADWIQISLDHSVPASLLVLSRVFTFNRIDESANIKAIKTTLSKLESDVVEDVIQETTGRSDYQQKLGSVKRQLELVEEEAKQEAQEESKRQEKKKQKELECTLEEAEEGNAKLIDENIPYGKDDTLSDDSHRDVSAQTALDAELESRSGRIDPERLDELRSKLKDISEDLAVLCDDSALSLEREQLESLTRKCSGLDDEERSVVEAVAARKSGVDAVKLREFSAKLDADRPSNVETKSSKGAYDTVDNAAPVEETVSAEPDEKSEEDEDENVHVRLQQKVGSMLEILKKDIDSTDSTIGAKLRVLDADHDGIMSYDEVVDALKNSLKDCNTDEEAHEIVRCLDIKKDGRIDTEELRELIRSLKEKEPEQR